MLRRLTLEEAKRRLSEGGVIVFPTETSYGLGCRASDQAAVARVVAAKGRPDGKPLPVLIPSQAWLEQHQPETPLLALAEAFWPGALTIVVPAFPGLAAEVTADTNMVGVRVSGHPMARALVEHLGEPLVATSANLSGAPAARTLADCDSAGLVGVDGVLDGGELGGSASTVVGLADGDVKIHRIGRISEAEIRAQWARARELG